MPVNAVAENALGTIGAVCWTAQMIPQLWKSWREKSTEGLSPYLVLLWGISAGFLGAYTLILNLNIPLILQPQLFGSLSLVSWGQCQYYGEKRSRGAAVAMTLGVMLVVGGFEAGMVFAVRPAYEAGSEAGVRGVQFFGIFSSVLISLALFPQYVEIWRHREVVGISILFMFVDMLGGVFSDLSLAFKDKFDVIAGVTYTLVVVLDGLVLIAALILNPRAEKRRQRETMPMGEAVADATAVSSRTITRVASPCPSGSIKIDAHGGACDPPPETEKDADKVPTVAESSSQDVTAVFEPTIAVDDVSGSPSFIVISSLTLAAPVYLDGELLYPPRAVHIPFPTVPPGRLEAPASTIAFIENEKATRGSILATFRRHYYAGPPETSAPPTVMSSGGRADDARAGKYVRAIPDQVLGWPLWELAAKAQTSARASSPCVALDLDTRLWKGKSSAAQAAITHALLARETARETGSTDKSIHGRFTEGLISPLRRVILDTSSTRLLQAAESSPAMRLRGSGDEHDYIAILRGLSPNLVGFTLVDTGQPWLTSSVHPPPPPPPLLPPTPRRPALHLPHLQRLQLHLDDWAETARGPTKTPSPTPPLRRQRVPRPRCAQSAADMPDLLRTVPASGDNIIIDRDTAQLPVLSDGIAHCNYFLEHHHGSAPGDIMIERLTSTLECMRQTPVALTASTAHLPAVIDGIVASRASRTPRPRARRLRASHSTRTAS
ncbi:hypothetical protein DFH09DRAFT_1415202 [Mycena vulgaris]|nr:hypothetical protein DFH09DRAFT_1415202 [Mycena vulgaris]